MRPIHHRRQIWDRHESRGDSKSPSHLWLPSALRENGPSRCLVHLLAVEPTTLGGMMTPSCHHQKRRVETRPAAPIHRQRRMVSTHLAGPTHRQKKRKDQTRSAGPIHRQRTRVLSHSAGPIHRR